MNIYIYIHSRRVHTRTLLYIYIYIPCIIAPTHLLRHRRRLAVSVLLYQFPSLWPSWQRVLGARDGSPEPVKQQHGWQTCNYSLEFHMEGHIQIW